MTRVRAILEHGLGRFLAHADFDELSIPGVMLAKVGTETALTIVKLEHDRTPFDCGNAINSASFSDAFPARSMGNPGGFVIETGSQSHSRAGI
jgi:hypothetical protein